MHTLLRNNHRFEDIRDYNIDQFVMFLDAAERAEAVSRVQFTIDLSAAIGGILGGGEHLEKHLSSLGETATGE